MKHEKLDEFLHVNRLKSTDLVAFWGVSKGVVSQILNGTTKLPKKRLEQLLNNSHGWDVSMLTEEKPENPAVENPQERVTIERLFAIIDSQRADINTLLAMIKEKDEQINQLREQLDARKRGTAPDAGNSSSADAV